MNFGAWIPQFWYDFIGRFVPGLVCLWYVNVFTNRLNITISWLNLQTGSANIGVSESFLVTIVAYLIGVLLGGLSFCTIDLVLHRFLPSDIASKYDAILLEYPKMGARISKLRAEQHLCSNLIVEFIIISGVSLFLTITNRIAQDWWFALYMPIIIIVLSGLLLYHLGKRYNGAIQNASKLLKAEKVER